MKALVPLLGACLLACGACSLIVDDEIDQGLNAECRVNGHCQSGVCHPQGGYCTQACSASEPCPTGLRCGGNGLCERLADLDAGGDTAPDAGETDGGGTPAGPLKVGFIYVGPVGDHGWTLTHDEGRRAAEEELDFMESHYQESVAAADAPEVIRGMIEQGDNVIVGTSHDFVTAIQNAALNYPDVRFLICSGFVTAPNMGTYFGRMYQAKYLAGMVAGYMTKTNRVGYLGPVVIPETVRHANAFTRGVRAANPDAVVEVEWVYAWFDPANETRLTNELLDNGADVVAAATDTTIPQATVDEYAQAHTDREVFSIGYDNANACSAFPDTCITTPYWNWGPLYKRIFTAMHDGTWDPHEVIWEQIVTDPSRSTVYLAPINLDTGFPQARAVEITGQVLPSLARDDAEALHTPFVGPLNDVDGNAVLAPGDYLADSDLLRMCWFVEGVVDAADGPGVVPPVCPGDFSAP